MQEYLQVGVLTKPHGIKGAVKVFPTTDDNKRFKKGQELLLEGKKESFTVKVETVQFFKQFAILKFEGINTPEEIGVYQGCPLLVDREHAVKLKKDEYFMSDLIGLPVYTEEEELIGEVKDVFSTGANEVLLIKAAGGTLGEYKVEKGQELLFPSIKECIKQIDMENERITAHIMPGLLD